MSTVVPYRMREAAELLGVSDDTMRRWAEAGRFDTITDAAGKRAIDGAELAKFAQQNATQLPDIHPIARASARNQFVGIVTRVTRDTVMAQVEVQCGPYRVVSLLSREAADDLNLRVGVTAIASIKSTNVVISLPPEPS